MEIPPLFVRIKAAHMLTFILVAKNDIHSLLRDNAPKFPKPPSHKIHRLDNTRGGGDLRSCLSLERTKQKPREERTVA